MTVKIRNFCIIAHVDHGKSTLADRLLELTGAVKPGQVSQILDRHPISRERGITIKLAPAAMFYEHKNTTYLLNLVDTPGHVDFAYEVERTLSAVEGAILLVDATQGVQAQTLSYYHQAKNLGLTIIPVINKIDSPLARIEATKLEMMELFNFNEADIQLISAKTGQGVDKLLNLLITLIPPPDTDSTKPLKALIFDSFYDEYKGVVAAIRLFEGQVLTGQKLTLNHSQTEFTCRQLGLFTATGLTNRPSLQAGQIGYLATGLKDISQVRVGDTIHLSHQAIAPITGFQQPSPLVFVSFYPVDNNDFPKLKQAMAKISLLDAAIKWRVEKSEILGGGVHCGFLGRLHAQITQERLERDHQLNLVATLPSVKYRYYPKGQPKPIEIESAAALPEPHLIDQIQEPIIKFDLFSQARYYGAIIQQIAQARGQITNTHYFGQRVQIQGRLPLSELMTDFFSQLETVTSGFVSFDWHFIGYQTAKLSKVELLVNGRVVEGLVFLFPQDKAIYQARQLVTKLKQLIPRQQFEVIIQARINNRIMARDRIPPFRKDVTAKLYGGDQTRKDKLLKKQKQGKKKLKAIGQVKIPQEAFLGLFNDN